MGPLSQEQKTTVRKKLAQTLESEKNVTVSEYWHSDNENDNSKMFKKLLCDFGYAEIYHSLSHLYND
jgi:5-formyltetrahydrofolate cyclo-ligase